MHFRSISSSCVFWSSNSFCNESYVHIICLLLSIWTKISQHDQKTQKQFNGEVAQTQNLGIHTNDGVFHVGCHRILCSLIFLRDITSLVWWLVFPHTIRWVQQSRGGIPKHAHCTQLLKDCCACLVLTHSCQNLGTPWFKWSNWWPLYNNLSLQCRLPPQKKNMIDVYLVHQSSLYIRFKVWVKSQTSHQLHCPNIPLGSHGQFDGWKSSYVLPQDHSGCGKNTPTLSTTILREIMRKSKKFPFQQQRHRWLLEHVKFANMGCIWTMFRS